MEQLKPGLAVATPRQHLSIWSYKSESDRDQAAEEYRRAGFAVAIDACEVRTFDWATPNRAAIETGCKTFDRQCQGIMTGNVMANTFLSSFIRPRDELRCNGFTSEHGHLQNYDLKHFESRDLHASRVVRYIRDLPRAQTDQLLLTMVFHWAKVDGRNTRVVHGAVVTDTLLKLQRMFYRTELGLHHKRQSCQLMDTVTPFLTDAIAINRRAVKLH